MLHAYEAGGGEASRDPAVDARLRQLRSELELDYLCDDAPLLIDESLEGLSCMPDRSGSEELCPCRCLSRVDPDRSA